MNHRGRLIIATRRSELALWQANHVAGLLRERHPGLEVDLLPLTTEGDRILERPLASIGGKGLFLKELEAALLEGRADIAVHSMKDVPAEETAGLVVDTVLERANPCDAVLARGGPRLIELPQGARVGTSSLRRQCQLRALRPDLTVTDLRGNVNTRIRKLDEGLYEAIVLACAGLERIGLAGRIDEVLEPPAWLPAASQGTIGVQRRCGDAEALALLASLRHEPTAVVTRAERLIAQRLQGSCQVPLAVYARTNGGVFAIDALVGTPDGTVVLRSSRNGPPAEADTLANAVADELLSRGAADIIERLGRGTPG